MKAKSYHNLGKSGYEFEFLQRQIIHFEGKGKNRSNIDFHSVFYPADMIQSLREIFEDKILVL